MSNPTSGSNVFKEGVATVASINNYDAPGTENTGASYKVQNVKMQRATYNFARDGGAVSTINLTLPYSIPTGSTITRVFTDVQTAVTSGGAATAALGIVAAGDLEAATVVTGAPWTAGSHLGTLTGGAVLVVTTAATSTILFTVATAALTAGDVTVLVEYFEGSDE